MRDEFGDYSFFEDIADVDENGKVIVTKRTDTNGENNRNGNSSSHGGNGNNKNTTMEDEYGDYSFLLEIEIDENGRVVAENKKTDGQHDNRNNNQMEDQQTTRRPQQHDSSNTRGTPKNQRAAVCTPQCRHYGSIVRNRTSTRNGDGRRAQETVTTPTNTCCSQQRITQPINRKNPRITATGLCLQDRTTTLMQRPAEQMRKSGSTGPTTRQTTADFWQLSTWGSSPLPTTSRTKRPATAPSGQSPVSVLVNPYSPERKRMARERLRATHATTQNVATPQRGPSYSPMRQRR